MTDLDHQALRKVVEVVDFGSLETAETSSVILIREIIGRIVVAEIDASSPKACHGEGDCGDQCGEYLAGLWNDARYFATFDPPTVLALLDELETGKRLLAETCDAWRDTETEVARLKARIAELEGVLLIARGRDDL